MTDAAQMVVRPETPIAGAGGLIRGFLRLVMIEHSVFALPFAYLAALSACFATTGSVHWVDLLLVTVAMVSARTLAMAANRIIDRRIDAANPRTRNRELVTGALSVRTALTGAIIALIVFLAAAAALNPLCLALSPLAVIPLIVYPYAKRFTNFPHAFLALAQAVAPIGAWVAITGSWAWPPVVLGVAVGLWIGGFDIMYTCQDVEADRQLGIHSVPARFGIATALWISSAVHVVTFALFAWWGVLAHAGPWWYAGLVVTGAVFVYEHGIVTSSDLRRINRAFLTANGFIGIALFAFGLLDLIARGLTW